MKLTPKDKCNIITAYTVELVPMIELAKKYNVNRASIYYVLKKAEVDTQKKKLTVSCTACTKPIFRTKKRIREAKNLFCDRKCYYDYVNRNGGWKENRVCSRHARGIAKKEFEKRGIPFLDEYRVHHIDKNQFNNHISNLMVFANQGDHIRYHRGFEVSPIWDGSMQNYFKSLLLPNVSHRK